MIEVTGLSNATDIESMRVSGLGDAIQLAVNYSREQFTEISESDLIRALKIQGRKPEQFADAPTRHNHEMTRSSIPGIPNILTPPADVGRAVASDIIPPQTFPDTAPMCYSLAAIQPSPSVML